MISNKPLTLKEKIKHMRVEYKVLIFFISVFVLYFVYKFVMENLFDDFFDSTQQVNTFQNESSSSSNSKSSINGAVSADRPIVMSVTDMKNMLNTIATEELDVEGIEIATEVQNPAIWIYIVSDGTRKDDLAEYYCTFLQGRGIQPKSVTILDEKAKQKGKIVEFGEKKCM